MFASLNLTEPNQRDVEEAVRGLVRIQATYSLPTRGMAMGRVLGVASSLPLTADDYFTLGMYSLNGTSLGITRPI